MGTYLHEANWECRVTAVPCYHSAPGDHALNALGASRFFFRTSARLAVEPDLVIAAGRMSRTCEGEENGEKGGCKHFGSVTWSF